MRGRPPGVTGPGRASTSGFRVGAPSRRGRVSSLLLAPATPPFPSTPSVTRRRSGTPERGDSGKSPNQRERHDAASGGWIVFVHSRRTLGRPPDARTRRRTDGGVRRRGEGTEKFEKRLRGGGESHGDRGRGSRSEEVERSPRTT